MIGGIDWNALLAQKYRIMQQQADADTTRANAGLLTAKSGANLDTVRAGLLPGQTAADIAKTNADTASVLESNRFIAPLAQSQIGLQRSQARQNTSQAGYYDSETFGSNLLNRGMPDFLNRLRSMGLFGSGL